MLSTIHSYQQKKKVPKKKTTSTNTVNIFQDLTTDKRVPPTGEPTERAITRGKKLHFVYTTEVEPIPD